MPDAPVLGGSATVKLDDAAFGADFHGPLVHDSVRAELNARRQGTRARAGSSRSPVWTGGGTVFGPQPRSYTFKVNRKEKRAALRSALSLHAGRDSLAVLDPAPYLETPSTKSAAALLAGWGQPKGVLVILTDAEAQAALSFRNLERVSVLPADGVGVADLIGASAVLASQPALDQLTERATS